MISTGVRSEKIELEIGSRAAMLITCVHQGYELYGSDRSFIETVQAIRATFPAADIEVVLPRGGPITAPLESVASRITTEPLWVLRRKDLKRLATIGLLRLPGAIFRAWRRIRRSDLVYINTTVVADYMLAARFCAGRTIIHVHEIPGGRVLPVLRALVRWSRADVVFNSRASGSAFAIARASRPDAPTTNVIYNGVAGPTQPEPQTFDGTRRLRLLMLGRISRIKGQEVLVDALAMLPPHLTPEVQIVGNAFEDEARERDLATSIDQAGLGANVTLRPFTEDPSSLYRWADVVVVPSRLPESLGRVAIEAMAFGRPPLASAIGGLVEVVADGETGWLVEPGSASALAGALRHLIEYPEEWRSYPEAGRRRYEALFSEAAARAAIAAVLRETLARRARQRRPGA